MFSAYVTSLIIVSCIGTLMAWSFYFPLSVGRLFAGQVGFMAIGAYLGAFTLRAGWPFVLVLVVVGLTGALVAAVISVPFRNLTGFSLAVASLAFSETVRVGIANNSALGGVAGVGGIPFETSLVIAVVVTVLLLVVFAQVERSSLGSSMRAMREDDVAAAGLGIPVARFRLASMALSGMTAAIAGALFASFVGFIAPEYFGFDRLVTALVFALVGGAYTVWGPVIGAVTLTLVPEFLRIADKQRLLVYGAIIALTVLFLPRGLASLRIPAVQRWSRRRRDRRTADLLRRIAERGDAAGGVRRLGASSVSSSSASATSGTAATPARNRRA